MTKLLFIVCIVLLPIASSAQGAFDLMLKGMYKETVPLISADSAQKVLDNAQAVFLDTRSSDEYEVSHIAGSQFVDYDSFKVKKLADLPKDSAIIVYCSVGYRSERIGEKLLKAGFTNVSNLYGGIFEWKNEQQEVVNKASQPTDSVHAFNKLWGVWLTEGVKVYDK
ncbi:MAG: rhodanese-like domain-containing protein [Cyclobacteriaceae bacterium]